MSTVGGTPTEKSPSVQKARANRNRNVELTDQFAALAAIVPGTQEEMDETIVLENSIKYLKQLQEKVKRLEEQNLSDSKSCTIDDNSADKPQPLLQIEARVSDKNLLIRIQCESCKGILGKALEEIEELHLNVVHSSAIPFGDSTLDITITAEMDDEVKMTVEYLVKTLRSSLIQFTAKSFPHVQER